MRNPAGVPDSDTAKESKDTGALETEKREREQKWSPAKKIVEYVRSVARLFHTPDGAPFASIRLAGHAETFDLRQTEFRDWIAKTYFQFTGQVAAQKAVSEAISVLQGISKYEGCSEHVFVRIGEHEGAVYVDLANERRDVVKISAAGWEVVSDYPVKFRRPPGMLPLPRPEPGGRIDQLKQFVNVGDDNQWVLLVSWLVSAFRASGPFPLLVLQGNHGSSKSTVTRIIRSLIDPNTAALRSEPQTTRDLMIGANNAWCMAFDNSSGVPHGLADALCRMSTGGAFSIRQLYSNADEVLFSAQRPIVINGIDLEISRGDLLDRALMLTLPSISSGNRLAEDMFYQELEAVKPRIVGALFDGVVCGLQRLPSISPANLPRMADFAKWIMACEPAFGWAEGTFMAAYQQNRQESNGLGLEGSLLVPVLHEMIKQNKGSWLGTATELFYALRRYAHHGEAKDRSWPKVPKVLSSNLRRLTPNLAEDGITVEFEKTAGSKSRRIIKIDSSRSTEAGPEERPPAVAKHE